MALIVFQVKTKGSAEGLPGILVPVTAALVASMMRTLNDLVPKQTCMSGMICGGQQKPCDASYVMGVAKNACNKLEVGVRASSNTKPND